MDRRNFLQQFCKIAGKRLFDDYQQVEYIQSVDGNQYIDTLYHHSAVTKCEMILAFTSPRFDSTQYPKLFGAVGANRLTRLGVEGAGRDFNFRRLVSCPNGADVMDYDYDLGIIYSDTKYKIVLTDDLTESWYGSTLSTLNGRGSRNLTTSLCEVTDWLFAMNGTPDRTTKIKLYSCKIYDSDVLVRDFIPCYRKSDGEIGLYDAVNDVFYTNQGTGAFLKGPNIN